MVPSRVTAGDTLDCTLPVTALPPGAGRTLAFLLRGPVNADITAGTSGTDWRIQQTAAQTGAWPAGTYSWSARVTEAGVVTTVAGGTLVVAANPASIAAGTDQRSHIERTLAAIEAQLEGRATSDQKRMHLGTGDHSREIENFSTAELLAWRSRYQFELATQQNAANGKRGGLLRVRFGAP